MPQVTKKTRTNWKAKSQKLEKELGKANETILSQNATIAELSTAASNAEGGLYNSMMKLKLEQRKPGQPDFVMSNVLMSVRTPQGLDLTVQIGQVCKTRDGGRLAFYYSKTATNFELVRGDDFIKFKDFILSIPSVVEYAKANNLGFVKYNVRKDNVVEAPVITQEEMDAFNADPSF